MITVSDAWKDAHKKSLLPETFIEISYSVTEPGLQEDARSCATLEEAFSDSESLVSLAERTPEKYATLERNSWCLNGSYPIFDGAAPGYTSAILSREDLSFVTNPTVTIAFSQLHIELIPGIVITWGEAQGEYASAFRVTAYNGGTQVAQPTVEGNTDVVSCVWLDMQNYDSITVEILAWSHPLRRARVSSIFLGVKTTYDKRDFLSFSHSQSVDLLSAALPKNEISFVLRNDDDRWNPEQPAGNAKYLLERQEIRVRYGMRVNGTVEWIDGGRFFLSSWTTPANGITASFTARDALEFLSDIYTGPRSGNLHDIATAVFAQAELPDREDGRARYVMADSLASYSTDFREDTNEYTLAQVLQMVAHMACCVLYQDRDGIVHLDKAPAETTDYVIDRNVSYSHPEFEISKPLRAVSADYGENQKAIVPVGDSGEVQTISNAFILSEADAQRVAQAAANLLSKRKTMSGEYRADPRLDALDTVQVESKYATNRVVITGIEYSTAGGGFRGKFTGRVLS